MQSTDDKNPYTGYTACWYCHDFHSQRSMKRTFNDRLICDNCMRLYCTMCGKLAGGSNLISYKPRSRRSELYKEGNLCTTVLKGMICTECSNNPSLYKCYDHDVFHHEDNMPSVDNESDVDGRRCVKHFTNIDVTF